MCSFTQHSASKSTAFNEVWEFRNKTSVFAGLLLLLQNCFVCVMLGVVYKSGMHVRNYVRYEITACSHCKHHTECGVNVQLLQPRIHTELVCPQAIVVHVGVQVYSVRIDSSLASRALACVLAAHPVPSFADLNAMLANAYLNG